MHLLIVPIYYDRLVNVNWSWVIVAHIFIPKKFMIVSDRGSNFKQMIVSDRGSWKIWTFLSLPLLHYFSIFLEPSFFGWYYCDIIKAENPTDFILIHQRTCGEEEKKASPSSICSFFEQKFPWDRCLEKLLLGLWGCRRIFFFFALFFCGRMVDIHTTNWEIFTVSGIFSYG